MLVEVLFLFSCSWNCQSEWANLANETVREMWRLYMMAVNMYTNFCRRGFSTSLPLHLNVIPKYTKGSSTVWYSSYIHQVSRLSLGRLRSGFATWWVIRYWRKRAIPCFGVIYWIICSKSCAPSFHMQTCLAGNPEDWLPAKHVREPPRSGAVIQNQNFFWSYYT